MWPVIVNRFATPVLEGPLNPAALEISMFAVKLPDVTVSGSKHVDRGRVER